MGLVERLREAMSPLADEAADEIERLRAALEQIADDPSCDGRSRNIAGAAMVGYRAALCTNKGGEP